MTVLDAARTKKVGKTTDKYMHYFKAYQHHFQPLKHRELNLLEIGVQNGGGLWMWQKYFPNAQIFGIDVDKYCKRHEGDRIRASIGSQGDPKFLRQVSEEAGGFDIVIDDGSHVMDDQITSFAVLFPLMRLGGIYVFEDLHTSYWPKFWSKSGANTINLLRDLIDDLCPWARRSPRAEKFAEKNPQTYRYTEQFITSMHFYDSMCFVYKDEVKPPKRVTI